jgi:hypothetical protein
MTEQIKIEFPYPIPSKEEFDRLPFDKNGIYKETKNNGDEIIHGINVGIIQRIKKEGYKEWYKVYHSYLNAISSEKTFDKNGYLLEHIDGDGYWYKYTWGDNGKPLTIKDSKGMDYIRLNSDYRYCLYYGLNDRLYHAGCQHLNKEDALAYCKKKLDNPEDYSEEKVNRAKAFYDIILNHNP